MIVINETDAGWVLHAQGDPEKIIWGLTIGLAQLNIKVAKDPSEKGLKEMGKAYGDMLGGLMILMTTPEAQKHIKDMSFSMDKVLGKDVN